MSTVTPKKIKRTAWTDEEIRIIQQMVEKSDNMRAAARELSKKFTHRTEAAILQRINAIRKQAASTEPESIMASDSDLSERLSRLNTAELIAVKNKFDESLVDVQKTYVAIQEEINHRIDQITHLKQLLK